MKLSTTQVAEITGISTRLLEKYRLLPEPPIPFERHANGRPYYDAASLAKWMADQPQYKALLEFLGKHYDIT